jgi:hypothetical protein
MYHEAMHLIVQQRLKTLWFYNAFLPMKSKLRNYKKNLIKCCVVLCVYFIVDFIFLD